MPDNLFAPSPSPHDATLDAKGTDKDILKETPYHDMRFSRIMISRLKK